MKITFTEGIVMIHHEMIGLIPTPPVVRLCAQKLNLPVDRLYHPIHVLQRLILFKRSETGQNEPPLHSVVRSSVEKKHKHDQTDYFISDGHVSTSLLFVMASHMEISLNSS
jgi:hypothetical protein